MMIRRTGSAALTLCLGVALMAGMAAAPAASSAPLTRPGAAPKTAVTLVVAGCNGCKVGVQRAINPDSTVTPSKPSYWNGPKGTVKAGRVTLSVPTAYTAGMTFTISTPWEGGTGFVANIVLGDSTTGGTIVSTAKAKNRKKATACWAGTSSATATIRVRVTRVTVEGYNEPAVAPLAWATPTVPTVGPLDTTFSGTMGNQEAYYC